MFRRLNICGGRSSSKYAISACLPWNSNSSILNFCCNSSMSEIPPKRTKYDETVSTKPVKSDIILSKFKGCMQSALIGDCLGAPYEQDYWDDFPSETQLSTFISQLLQPNLRIPYKIYTDDTALSFAVARALLKANGFCAEVMANSLASAYFADTGRGYGRNVGDVFRQLRSSNCKQPFAAAACQFDGQGSYGNGGAMRVSPVALFFHGDIDKLIEAAVNQARITHAHAEGYVGAAVQCLAVTTAMKCNAHEAVDTAGFVQTLIEHLVRLENDIIDKQNSENAEHKYTDSDNVTRPFTEALQVVSKLLSQQPAPGRSEVVDLLGHDISAVGSVPTAIYCFLRHAATVADISGELEAKSPILETIKYAISLGGDTDTIASMAGSLAGAFWGDSLIPSNLARYCESSSEALSLASDLYSAANKN